MSTAAAWALRANGLLFQPVPVPPEPAISAKPAKAADPDTARNSKRSALIEMRWYYEAT